MKPALRRLRMRLLTLVYPRRAVCMGCGSPFGCDRDDLCENCRRVLAGNFIGPRAAKSGSGLDFTAFAHPYVGPAGGMVRRLKYGGAAVLAEAMGAELARAARGMPVAKARYVTAVPMHPRRLRVRGRNHAELLAVQVAQRLNLEYAPLLVRTRNAPQQARLDGKARRRNLTDGFAVAPEWAAAIRDMEILLIDDVYTTGSTAAGCAAALRSAGARRVWFAAYALGERKPNG